MRKIEAISSIDSVKVYQVLSSQTLTNAEKVQFITQNSGKVKEVIFSDISKGEFECMMKARPLVRFRPLKNSFTKKGDDKILAEALHINPCDIKKYINSIISMDFDIHEKQGLDDIYTVKSYVYRHGTKKQALAFLEWELSDVKNILKNLYHTLDENTGGFAGYFNRPIHRMDNSTMRKIYNVIDSKLKLASASGAISNEQQQEAAHWALIRIYQIQNDSRFIRACKIYQELVE